MSFFKLKFLTLLVVFSVFLLSFGRIRATENENIPSAINLEKIPDYYLSLALRNLARARNLVYSGLQKEAFELYFESAKDFENYFLYAKKENIPPEVFLNAALVNYETNQKEKAELYLNQALNVDPKFRDAIVFKIRVLIRQGNYQEAEALLEKQVSNSPEDSDMLFLLGSINKELGNHNKAILYFTSLYDSIMNRNGNPKYKIHALKNLADLYYLKGDAKKALYYYQAYLVLNPNDLNSRFQVAQIFHYLGDFGAAKKILESIQRENPKETSIQLLLAEMYFIESRVVAYSYIHNLHKKNLIPENHLVHSLHQVLVGRYTNACKFLENFIKNNEKRTAARLAWLDCIRNNQPEENLIPEYKDLMELSMSLRQFNLALRIGMDLQLLQFKYNKPKEEIAETYWAISESFGQLDSPNRAILYAKKAISVAPNSEKKETYEVNLGHLLLGEKIKRYSEAIQIANKVIEKNKKNHYAYYLKANAYFLKQNYPQSLEAINQAILLEENNPGYYFFRGMLYEKLGNLELMEINMLKSINLNPTNPVAYNYLGYVYADKNIKLEEAYELIKKAIELEPDNGAYQDSLGWIYFRKGDIENALFHLYLAKQMLEDKEIKDFTVYEHLGDVYFVKKDFIIARDYWKKAFGLAESEIDKERISKKINSK